MQLPIPPPPATSTLKCSVVSWIILSPKIKFVNPLVRRQGTAYLRDMAWKCEVQEAGVFLYSSDKDIKLRFLYVCLKYGKHIVYDTADLSVIFFTNQDALVSWIICKLIKLFRSLLLLELCDGNWNILSYFFLAKKVYRYKQQCYM